MTKPELKERIDEALQPVSGAAALDLDGRRALLREASMFRHNYADSKYEDNAGLLGKALFLTLIALAIAVALAATFDRESWLLLGAAGGLISRLSRVARRRPSPSDYGAEWSSLILSPAGGAVAGWVGVLIMVTLSNPPFDAVSNEFSELWDDPKKPLGLVLAFAFGFSERLFSRLTRWQRTSWAVRCRRKRQRSSQGAEEGQPSALPPGLHGRSLVRRMRVVRPEIDSKP